MNTSIFRVNSVVSAGGYQFVAYYNAASDIVVGRRRLPDVTWDLFTLPGKYHVSDAHNVVVIGVSADGLLHLSYDHHANHLHYRISSKPLDIHTFGDERAMTGQTEDHVTYPQFINGPHGELYFFYRDGASGNGSLCLNRYDANSHSWQSLHHPLVDGENKCNPYWWRPAVGADGSIHLAWCWRDTPKAETNHDLCYARSNDGGRSWQHADGKSQPLPITQENAEVVDAIPKGSNLINQCSTAVDADNYPHMSQYHNDANGVPQYFHVWFDGKNWHRNQVSSRTEAFSLSGVGSLAIPISRPEIAITRTGVVTVIAREAEAGGGIRLYRAAAPYEHWEPTDISREDLGNWEPTFDPSRLHDDGILSLFVLPVRQGNHEKTTQFPPQPASIIEVPLP